MKMGNCRGGMWRFNRINKISEISICSTLGQVVLIIPNAKDIDAVDVSSLKTGTYFIKVNSDKGIANTRFVKL